MSGVRAGPLVGRDAELAVGLELLRDVAAGGSATLLITGEAGIGKTELTKWIEAAAEGFGASVARGGAHPFERERPFGALATALGFTARSLDPRRAGIARLLIETSGATASDVRYRVIAATVDLVERECSQAPLVLIVEDLQWADEATLAAFGQIASDLTHLPVLLVGSMRPSPRRAELDVPLDHCYRLGARLVELRSWTANDVRQYVESELEAAPGPALASIVDKAGGNPLSRSCSGRSPERGREACGRRSGGARPCGRSACAVESGWGGLTANGLCANSSRRA